ncbi:MAG: class I SAM-dependent methyltransferase [Planctomycetes bacterium]|nr:class I SAM-dependent methyltransferase [Planctomycetota bacterium]
MTLHDRVPAIETPSRVVRCPDCSMIFLTPRLATYENGWTNDPSFLETNYLPELELRGLCPRTRQLDRRRNASWHSGIFKTLEQFATTRTLLDVGCSIGTTLLAAADRAWGARGIELSAVLAGYGRNVLGVDIMTADFETAHLDAQDFDCVTMLDYLPHCFQPYHSLKRAHGMLRDGGVLFASCPNVEGRAHLDYGIDWCCFVSDHYFYYSAESLTKSLVDAGFESVLVLRGLPLPNEPLHRQIRRLRGARKRPVLEVHGDPLGDTLYAWAIKSSS